MAARATSIRPTTIRPEEFVINLTNRCPLKCSHCCFSSDMQQVGHLQEAEILRAIDEVARCGSITRVNFVGGEPLLHPEIVEHGCAHARSLGLEASITTSAFFAKTDERAERTLAPLARAGLTRIIISYDDPHAKFLPEKFVVNACRAARRLGLHVKISVVIEPGCRIDAAYMARLLELPEGGDENVHVYEVAINSTGRALDGVDEAERRERRQERRAFRGPCNSMLRQISVGPEGDISPCCGVIPPRPQLKIGTLEDDAVDGVVAAAYQNLLYKWIAFEGPIAVLSQITADTDNPVCEEDFDGNCNACNVLFTTPEYGRLLNAALPGKAASLAVQEAVLTVLDLFRPPRGYVPPPTVTETIARLRQTNS